MIIIITNFPAKFKYNIIYIIFNFPYFNLFLCIYILLLLILLIYLQINKKSFIL